MSPRWSSHALAVFCLCWLFNIATPIVLQPFHLRSGDHYGNLQKRAVTSALDLQNVETFHWGSGDGKFMILYNVSIGA